MIDLSKILNDNEKERKKVSIGLTSIVSWLFLLLGIYGFNQYGIALFILIPFFIGLSSTILYGYKREITIRKSLRIGSLTLTVFVLGIIVFAIEGLICIAMAAPFGLLFTWFGSLIGYFINNKINNKSLNSIIVLVFMIPTISFIEKDIKPELMSVVTSIEIDSDQKTVWKNIIEFPQLDEPKELIFKTGIAYPINAKIKGTGVGAVRHCNFTTGSFVEPITLWDEPNLLKFDVLEQPASMKELSYLDIDAPHLHDYLVSKKGQFKLTSLGNGKTL